MGVEYFVRRISWKMPRWLFTYEHSLLLMSERIQTDLMIGEGVECRLAGRQDAGLMKAIGMTEVTFQERLDKGDVGAIVVENRSAVATLWAVTGSLFLQAGKTGSFLNTGTDSFYFHYGFTLPQARSKGYYKACVSLLFDYFASRGRPRGYGLIDADNDLSLRVHEKLGYKVVGDAIRMLVCGVSVCYYKSWPHPVRKLEIRRAKLPSKIRAV
jgi:RimJ/RimL family protein N-acetyltransferase